MRALRGDLPFTIAVGSFDACPFCCAMSPVSEAEQAAPAVRHRHLVARGPQHDLIGQLLSHDVLPATDEVRADDVAVILDDGHGKGCAGWQPQPYRLAV